MMINENLPAPMSCDTFVALPPATADGCVVFGKNSDRPGREVQEIVYVPGAKHGPGKKLHCTYIEIDQCPSTFAVILSKPAWMWGAEMGANDQGVCIGNEAVWTKLNDDADDLTERLLGMDLVRLGVERGSNARNSLDIITSLLAAHGQGGPCVEGDNWSYHNSFLIADRNEAWVLETAGNYWAAEKITNGVRNISNQLTITTTFHLTSPDLILNATSKGFYNEKDGPFNFAKVFELNYTDPFRYTGSRFCNGRKLLKEYSKDGKFGIQEMMHILRDEDSGISMPERTVSSQVSILRPYNGAEERGHCCHWFTGTLDPRTSLFKPFVFVQNPSIGSLTKSHDYGDEDPRILKPRFQKSVNRRHELYKCHDKLNALLLSGSVKKAGEKTVHSMKELETKCIKDVESLLQNHDGSNETEIGELFQNMAKAEFELFKNLN